MPMQVCCTAIPARYPETRLSTLRVCAWGLGTDSRNPDCAQDCNTAAQKCGLDVATGWLAVLLVHSAVAVEVLCQVTQALAHVIKLP